MMQIKIHLFTNQKPYFNRSTAVVSACPNLDLLSALDMIGGTLPVNCIYLNWMFKCI